MSNCRRCFGRGVMEWEEDGRYINDACYHCGTTGKVDDNTVLHDDLYEVANRLAWQHVSELKRYKDSDPDGEDFAFCAAENMMDEYSYMQEMQWSILDRTLNQILAMDLTTKQVLIGMMREQDRANLEIVRNMVRKNEQTRSA